MKISPRTQERAIRENVLDYTRRAYQKSLKTGKLNGKYFPDGSPLLTLNSREVDIFKTEEGYRVDYSCGNQLWQYLFTPKEVELPVIAGNKQ